MATQLIKIPTICPVNKYHNQQTKMVILYIPIVKARLESILEEAVPLTDGVTKGPIIITTSVIQYTLMRLLT